MADYAKCCERDEMYTTAGVLRGLVEKVRAFLRRDEARWEPSDNVFTHDEKTAEARRAGCEKCGPGIHCECL